MFTGDNITASKDEDVLIMAVVKSAVSIIKAVQGCYDSLTGNFLFCANLLDKKMARFSLSILCTIMRDLCGV